MGNETFACQLPLRGKLLAEAIGDAQNLELRRRQIELAKVRLHEPLQGAVSPQDSNHGLARSGYRKSVVQVKGGGDLAVRHDGPLSGVWEFR